MAQIKRIPGPGARNLHAAIKGLDGTQGKVGWFESAKYPSGAPVAGVAMVQEYGSATQGIPPRSFFRTTAADKQGEWKQVAEQVSRRVIHGEMQPSAVVEALALKGEGDVRAKISEITDPPLKDATIEARKRRNAKGRKDGKGEASSKPLVDSGLMLATLTSQVTK